MKKVLLFCLLLPIFHGYSQETDTLKIYFSLNDTRVSAQESKNLDSFISNHLLEPGEKLILLGYTDYLGNSSHNDSLSEERAKSVQEKLLASGFNKDDIKLCTGEGEIQRTPLKTKKGYMADRKVLIIKDINATRKSKNIIDINKVKVNETIALKNIFFKEGLPDISPYSIPEMKQLYVFLKDNKNVTIQVEGHICCLTSKEGTDVPWDTSTLSKMRAKAVCDYLITQGIDKSRLRYIGLGNTKPAVSPELTEEDMETNRRVEIRILTK